MSELEKLADQLNALLRREIKCLEATASCLKSDRKALISGQGSVLGEATENWQTLTSNRADLDRQRALILDRISAILDIPAARLNVTKIARFLEYPLDMELRNTGDRVRQAARQAALEAAVGRDLLEESAHFHEGLLRNIAAATSGDPPTYGQKQRTKSATVTLIDRMG